MLKKAALEDVRRDVLRALLKAVLNDCKQKGARYLTYLCDEAACSVLAELGFRRIGKYVLYTKTLGEEKESDVNR